MKTITSLVLLLLFFAGISKAEPLTILTENFPPYNYKKDGAATGLSTEILQEVMKEAGAAAEIVFYPWARAYQTAQNRKNSLIYSIARIPDREELFQWVGVIAPYKTSFYKLKSNTNIQVRSLAEARQYTVGVSQQDVIEIYLKSQNFPSLNSVSNDILNIRMLARGRLDLIAYDETSFVHKLRAEGLDPSLFERVYRLDDLSGSLYMAFNRDSDPELVQRFRVSLETLKKSGQYKQIQSKYLLLN